MRAAWPGLVAVLTVLAGCAGSGDEEGPGTDDEPPVVVPEDWAARALPQGGGHDHNDPAMHANLSTPNFSAVGWDPLITDYHGTTSGEYVCGDVAPAGERKIAVVNSFASDVAFVVADVTDPAKPQKLGEYVLKRTHVYDVAVFPDASFVVLAASSGNDAPDPGQRAAAPLRAEWRDACTGRVVVQEEEVPFQGGVLLVSIQDPLNPRFVDYAPQPGLGVHSVFATIVDGERYILSSTTNLLHQASYFTVLTVEDVPAVGPKIQAYGTYEAQYAGMGDGGSALVNGHVDGWIQKHPKTGELLAYLANWDGGLIVAELEGPGRITTRGVWNDHDVDPDDPADLSFSKATGQYHEALPLDELWDGRHYTFIGQELGASPPGRSTGQIVKLDTTDPSNPAPVARWTLPVDVRWGTDDDFLVFSTHYIEVHNRTLFVSLYHGGLWAADADNASTEMPTLGVFLPTNVSPEPPPPAIASFRWTPTVLDVHALPSGELVLWDSISGVYVVRFDPTVPVPVPPAWTRDSWI